jgi:hypothetical protein
VPISVGPLGTSSSQSQQLDSQAGTNEPRFSKLAPTYWPHLSSLGLDKVVVVASNIPHIQEQYTPTRKYYYTDRNQSKFGSSENGTTIKSLIQQKF